MAYLDYRLPLSRLGIVQKRFWPLLSLLHRFLLVYGVDGVLTICHRIMLHENLGEAHRKHVFQLMANATAEIDDVDNIGPHKGEP